MLRAKTLINGRDELPDLRGDPFEGLRHRVTVGLVALYCALRGRDVYTYQRAGDFIDASNETVANYNIDVVARDQSGNLEFTEVLTGHKGWENHRNTCNKLAALSSHGRSYVGFDSRETAKTVINLWINSGLADFPTGTFDSVPKLEWIRNKMEEACAAGRNLWRVKNMGTTDWYWRKTLGRDENDIDADTVTSLNW